MPFSHDVRGTLAWVVELVNSTPPHCRQDRLTDVAALADLVRRHEIGHPDGPTEEDLRAVLELRATLREVFLARDDAAAAAVVNRILALSPVTPRLTDHDGYAWHLHYTSPGATLAEHLSANAGMALARLLAAGERQRLSHCAAPGCEQVLVDLSRNRSKRYCDPQGCGNRVHAAAYRDRLRAQRRP